jgi:hypothetical protein
MANKMTKTYYYFVNGHAVQPLKLFLSALFSCSIEPAAADGSPQSHQRLGGALEILSTALLVALYNLFATSFYYYDILVSDWIVVPLDGVFNPDIIEWVLVLADWTIFGGRPLHFNELLFLFFNDET